jgi:hypothetical protein
MTDREKAVAEIDVILPVLNVLESHVLKLEEVVGEAQNGPPAGKADGTLTDPEWSKTRDLVRALQNAGKLATELLDK